MLLHDAQEFDDDLGTWPDHDLSLSSFLRIVANVLSIEASPQVRSTFESVHGLVIVRRIDIFFARGRIRYER